MTAAERDFFQVAWVVPDLEAAIRTWVATTGAGPFHVLPHRRPDGARYRGAPTAVDYSLALGQAGRWQVELIEQHDDGPSVYRDLGPGMHHLGGLTTDLDADRAAYRALGVEAVFEGRFQGVRFAYFDTRAQLGHMVELVEHSPVVEATIAAVAQAARGWDGTDPIRSLPAPPPERSQ
ncbi:hypothetical protein BJF78_14365 [Pseudonocardia sp. CNS-139]|nr:hypothetical protein BJF78_14365 [Pseudonocardia sp. CNS-139]